MLVLVSQRHFRRSFDNSKTNQIMSNQTPYRSLLIDTTWEAWANARAFLL